MRIGYVEKDTTTYPGTVVWTGSHPNGGIMSCADRDVVVQWILASQPNAHIFGSKAIYMKVLARGTNKIDY